MRQRRAFCLVVVLSASAQTCSRKNEGPRLAILCTGDLRGAVAASLGVRELARRATWVDRSRVSAPALLQVDTGDLAPSEADAPRLSDASAREARARLVLRAYRRMGIDAITVGERDIALGVSTWRSLCEEAKVAVVAANVVASGGEPLFPATKIIRTGDVSIGVFGVLDLESERWEPPVGVRVVDAAAAASAAVGSLRAQGAQLIVGLFHVSGGLERARAIGAATGGVDLIVVGHGSASAARGGDVARVDVSFGGHAPRLTLRQAAQTSDLPEQLGVRLLVRLAEGPVAQTLAESVLALSKASGVRSFGENWTYGSSALCSGCHAAEAAQWKTTDHARAYATLQHVGKARDPACMGCHVTGFLQPGGPQSIETALQFANVGCEACHGPSVAHVVSVDKHTGTSRTVPPTVCLGCHTPDQNVGEFAVSTAMREIVGPGHGGLVPGVR